MPTPKTQPLVLGPRMIEPSAAPQANNNQHEDGRYLVRRPLKMPDQEGERANSNDGEEIKTDIEKMNIAWKQIRELQE